MKFLDGINRQWVHFRFMDGVESFEAATIVFIDDGQLHLYIQDGAMADREHVGSYPLANIRRWWIEEKK